jgi:glycosyltransferase involved in cell wall biosynthesis
MSELILSVIIPSYNSEVFLEECLKSVESEAQAGVEFILVDGASSDATMEIVERFRHLFSHIISEPDRGQSDAFNKGYALATGRYLTWLNSDDVLCSGALAAALPVLSKSKKDWLVANSVYLDEAGRVTRCCRSGGFEHFAVKRGQLNVFGPSTFFSKKLFEELGEIDESYHFCMDTEYWWRIVDSGRTYERIQTYFWGLRLHTAAKTANVLLTGEYPPGMREESQKIAARYFPQVSKEQRRFAVKLARMWRVLNLAYVHALVDTWRKRGTSLVDH